jgi:hypothetical protein
MTMKRQTRNIILAFLHGLTGAGLFRKLNYPGAPTHFVDPRSVEEIIESGDLGEEHTHQLKEHRDQQDNG